MKFLPPVEQLCIRTPLIKLWAVNLKKNLHRSAKICIDSEDDADLDDEVFIQTSLIRHPSLDASKIGASKKPPKKFTKLSQRQPCLALCLILILDCLTIFGLVNGKYSWIFITFTIMFTLMAAIILLNLIWVYFKKNGFCSNEIKVSQVFNAHNNDEIYWYNRLLKFLTFIICLGLGPNHLFLWWQISMKT